MKMTTSFQQTKRETNTANNTTPTHLIPIVVTIVAADDREDILDQPAADVPMSSRQPRPAPPRSRAPAKRKEAHFLILTQRQFRIDMKWRLA